MVKDVNKDNFYEEIKDGKVIVDFKASWCGPCRMLAPIYEEVSDIMADVKFLRIDIDVDEDIANELNIMSIPTLVLFKDGQKVGHKLGFMEKVELVNLILFTYQ